MTIILTNLLHFKNADANAKAIDNGMVRRNKENPSSSFLITNQKTEFCITYDVIEKV